jgi:hypothetical protein
MNYTNRLQQLTTGSGTGNLALGAAALGFRSITSVYSTGQRFVYVVQDEATGQWELGIGYISGGALVRETPVEGSSATPVSFGANSKSVLVVHPAMLSAGQHAAIFGDGSDGDLALTSGTVTLTKNANYRNLSISGTGELKTNGYKLRVSGLCDLSAASTFQHLTADGLTGGVSPATAVTAGTGGAGAAGGAGKVTAGDDGSNASNLAAGNGGGGLFGGAGGSSTGGAGGDGGTGGNAGGVVNYGIEPLQKAVGGAMYLAEGGAGGGGGGGGAGDNVSAIGGGGGTGGNGGGVLDLAFAVLKVGSSTLVGTVSAKGGNGDNGVTPPAGDRAGGGGGNGGGGGYAHIVIGMQIGAKTGWVSCLGGNGGNGGDGPGAGNPGAGGCGGSGGTIHIFNLSTGIRQEVIGAAGGDPGAAQGGGAGGACSGGT